MAVNALFISAFFLALRTAAFNLYPSVDPDNLANAFGISTDCLDALNETVTCDQTLFQMSNTVDSYLWTTDNVTDLCTTACISSTTKWWSDVQDRCATDTLVAYGKMIPAESIAGRFSDGLSITCLQSGPDSNGSESHSNTKSVPIGSIPFSNNTSPYSNSSTASNATTGGSSWCLIESQEWIGSDIIRPDCSINPTDPSCLNPLDISPEQERIANLYPDEVLCSDCFIKMFHQRMSSPYLPDSDYSDYLVAQYQDILDVCKANMPELVIRDLPFYGDAPSAFEAKSYSESNTPPFSSNNTQYTNGSNSTTTCTGQTIRMADINNEALSNLTTSYSLCDYLSKNYGLTTGDLAAVFGNPYCEPSQLSYCAPAACTLTRVLPGTTCGSIADANDVTTLQFSKWNPNINGLCDSPREGDYVCIGAPGGSYIPPLVSNATNNASTQQPGGDSGDNTVTSTSAAPAYGNSTSPTRSASLQPSSSFGSRLPTPSPIQKGISTSCTIYGQALRGDSCTTFAVRNHITTTQLYALNDALGNTGQNCNTAFWSGYYYCVSTGPSRTNEAGNDTTTAFAASTMDSAPIGTTTTTPDLVSTIKATIMSTVTAESTSTSPRDPMPTPSTANNNAAVASPSPSPTQSGISWLCAKFAQAHTGDTCASFAAANGIAPLDLYERNTALGSKGENCGTKFWGGYYYCVGGTD